MPTETEASQSAPRATSTGDGAGDRARVGGTFAGQQEAVVAEAQGALAAEAPDLVDADAVRTDGWDLRTLVDIWGGHKPSGAA